MTNSTRTTADMSIKQILLYVNKMMKPFELSIKSYGGQIVKH